MKWGEIFPDYLDGPSKGEARVSELNKIQGWNQRSEKIEYATLLALKLEEWAISQGM